MKKLFSSILIIAAFGLGAAPSAQALTLSPPTTDTTAKPGETVKITAKLFNEGNAPLVVKPEVLSFRAKSENGQPEFFDDPTKTDLQHWITLPSAVALAPKERRTAVIDIAVPPSADPGGHYAAVFWGAESPKVGGTGTGIQGRIAMLILVSVEGKVVEDAKMIEFGVKNKVVTHLPVEFVARFQNNGTVHAHPAGSVTVKDILGRTAAVLPFNIQPATGNVLPKSIRRFDFAWVKNAVLKGATEWRNESDNFAFGRYTARLVAAYGTTNKTVTATASFWVLPWMLMIAGAAGIVVVLLVLSLLVRSYDRYVIRKYARKESKK